MSNQHAECLREQAAEVESVDTVEMAIVGVTMRNAADEIDRLQAERDEWRTQAEVEAGRRREFEASYAAATQDAARYLGDRDIAVGRRVEAERERDALQLANRDANARIEAGRHEIGKLRAKLDGLRDLALEWHHHEDCAGYADEDGEEEAEPVECDCGTGDVLRKTMPAGTKVYVDRSNERYGLSRIVEPQAKEPA